MRDQGGNRQTSEEAPANVQEWQDGILNVDEKQ